MSRAARLIFQDAVVPGPFEGEFGHHHWHLVLLQAGEMRQSYRDRDIRFAPGDLRLSRPDARHRLTFGEAGARCAVMLLPQRWVPTTVKAHCGTMDSVFGHDATLKRLTDSTRDDFSVDDLIQREFAVREVVAKLAQRLTGKADASTAEWLLQARSALYERQESIARTAREANVSPEHLAREFVRHFGFKPVEFRLAARTRAAVELLRRTEAALADVAYQTGFSSQSHMTNAVRRWTRRTPRQWRLAARRSDQIPAIL